MHDIQTKLWLGVIDDAVDKRLPKHHFSLIYTATSAVRLQVADDLLWHYERSKLQTICCDTTSAAHLVQLFFYFSGKESCVSIRT